MATVAEAAWEVLRARGIDTVFGNPGSNELPFLAAVPDDVHYVLGLHEGVVLGMADGYAQATGRPALVNLHSAAGTGNAMGALTNAAAAHTPLVVTAGQQVRSTLGLQPMLANVDATTLPRPLVSWSAEPASACDVVRTLDEAVHRAGDHPRGPVYVSIPYDDWWATAEDPAAQLRRRVTRGGDLPPDVVAEVVDRMAAAEHPVLVLGPEVDAEGAAEAAVRVAERWRAPVWVAPSAPRCPFPTRHPAFRGVLPASVAGICAALEGHDLVLVLGGPVFRYHQHQPGRYLPEGTTLLHVTSDAGEAARAPVGEAWVGSVAAALGAIADRLPASTRAVPTARALPPPPAAQGPGGGIAPAALFAAVDRLSPDDVVHVNESTSTVTEAWTWLSLRPGGYFFPAAGGLGFGMPAAVGVALADRSRPVVVLVGDGSANYGLSALWTAAVEDVPVVFVVLVNGTYGALRGFAGLLGAGEVPGLDVPGIDFCALARGYGVPAERVGDLAAFEDAYSRALARGGPVLLEVPTARTSPF